jgi:PAS domain S-box-containing protein
MDVAKRKTAPIMNTRLQGDRQQKNGRLAWGTAQEYIESMMDAVVITDCELKIVQFNRAFTEFFGYGSEVIGELPTKFVCEKDVPRLEEIVKEAMKDPVGRGSLKDFECTLITKDEKDLHESLVRCAGFCECSADAYFRSG